MVQAPIGRSITLSDDFVSSLDEAQLRAYLATLDEVASGSHESEMEIRAFLEERFADAAIGMPPIELHRLAEQLAGRGDASFSVVTDEGEVLLNHPGRSSLQETDTKHADPAHPDRPSAV